MIIFVKKYVMGCNNVVDEKLPTTIFWTTYA